MKINPKKTSKLLRNHFDQHAALIRGCCVAVATLCNYHVTLKFFNFFCRKRVPMEDFCPSIACN